MTKSATSAGDPIPPDCELIRVRVSELKQLFNAIDPSPFRERDLDQIFLYDWWPIRAEAALADRLSVMPVRIWYRVDGSGDAWRSDWPATSPAAMSS
ncbi:MAG: hypothetical protein ACRD3G_10295 [Vicinamibacterales bacterium]